MSNKSNLTQDIVYSIKLGFIVLFVGLLFFPLSLMALDGPDTTELNSESETALIDFSLKSYWDGEYQTNFENWFSKHYPLRSDLVSGYRRMRYNIENFKPLVAYMQLLNGTLGDDPVVVTPTPLPIDDPIFDPDNTGTPDQPDDPDNPDATPTAAPYNPLAKYLAKDNIYAVINRKQLMQSIVEPLGFHGNNAVMIGKSGYLYEQGYIDEYMGYNASASVENLQLMVERLEYIQEQLEKRGITMLYVISSSKASQYADYIPDWYKKSHITPENFTRTVDKLREILKTSSLRYLDSSAYYEEIGLLVTFPKTGIHWNLLASGESTAKLIDMYAQYTGKPIKQLKITGYTEQSGPYNFGNPEQDVYNILYGALPEYKGDSIVDEAYYQPTIEVVNPDAPKHSIFIQGGSFCQGIMPFLSTYEVADYKHMYYCGQYGFGGVTDESNVWANNENWAYWLENVDIAIFEATEAAIPNTHYSGEGWTTAQVTLGHNAVYDSLYEYLKRHEGDVK